jgi:hypothetical protein
MRDIFRHRQQRGHAAARLAGSPPKPFRGGYADAQPGKRTGPTAAAIKDTQASGMEAFLSMSTTIAMSVAELCQPLF